MNERRHRSIRFPIIREYVIRFTLDGCKGVTKQQAAHSYEEAKIYLKLFYEERGNRIECFELVRTIPYPH